MLSNFIKKALYVFWKHSGLKNIEKLLATRILEQQYNKEKYQNDKSLIKKGFKVFSQQDEDGIIEEIFKRVGVKSKSFIEVGVETGEECNTTYLLHKGWKGVWIEGNKEHQQKINKLFKNYIDKNLNVIFNRVNPTNINTEILKYFKPNQEIDLLSIDIGVHTFHTLEKIDSINPRVIVAEYNAKYGPSLEWKTNYDKNLNWDGSDNYGASLKSFEKMLSLKKYKLVGCNISGVNAFFVKEELINNNFEKDFSSEYHFNEGRYWLKNAFEKQYKVKIL